MRFLFMTKEPQLPSFNREKPKEIHSEIVWEESNDIYQALEKNIDEFIREKGIDRTQKSSVYIKANALENLIEHLGSNLKVEQGGILFGRAYQDSSFGIYTEITEAVAAPHTIGTSSHVEFTVDSWMGILDYAKEQLPGEKIVGWYHSHPNIGVFMSGTDMNTQRRFFYRDWCLSIVRDPVRNEIGYFLGNTAREVRPVIYDDRGNLYLDNDIVDRLKEKNKTDTLDSDVSFNIKGISDRETRQLLTHNKVVNWILFKTLIFLTLITISFSLFLFLYRKEIFNPSLSQVPVISAPTFKVYMKRMPVAVFTYLNNGGKDLLRYPIVNFEDNISKGDEITVLVISQEGQKKDEDVKNIELDFDAINLEGEGVEIDSDLLSSISYEQYPQIKTKTKTPKKISLDRFLQTREGLIFFMYSSSPHPSLVENSSKSNPESNSKKIIVSDLIYVPRNIEYKNSNNTPKKIKIDEILQQ